MKNVALLTGSTGGLGLCFGEILAQKGYNLLLIGRSEERIARQVQDLKEKYPIEIDYIAVDLAERGSRDDLSHVSRAIA